MQNSKITSPAHLRRENTPNPQPKKVSDNSEFFFSATCLTDADCFKSHDPLCLSPWTRAVMKNRQALSHCSDHKNPTQCVREISPLIRRGGRSRRRGSRDKKKREQLKKRGEGRVEVRGCSGEKRSGPSFLTGYKKPELSSEGGHLLYMFWINGASLEEVKLWKKGLANQWWYKPGLCKAEWRSMTFKATLRSFSSLKKDCFKFNSRIYWLMTKRT